MVTIKEIAALAQVSRSTVSRVINNDPAVSDDTRVRVNQVIDQLQYHPNMAARRLAGGHTRVIGLIVPMGVPTLFQDPFFSEVAQGAAAGCSAENYTVVMWLAEPESERRSIRRFLNNHIIDGAIFTANMIDDPLLKTLMESGLPFILVGRHPASDELSYIDIDNQNAAFEMVSYLARTGFTRIATITGSLNMNAAFSRLAGYKKAMRHYNLPVEPEMIVEGNFTEQGGYNAMMQLLSVHPEAVFVASDSMALGALRAAKEAGLRIPDDISITGFDDMPFAATCTPPLTTVRQPVQQLGVMAAQTLIDMIGRPGASHHHIILPTELVIRASSRSPKMVLNGLKAKPKGGA